MGIESRLSKVYNVVGRISQLSALAASLLLFVLVIAGVTDVVAAQTFLRPIYISYEIVVTFLVLVVWLSVPLVEHSNEQITTTFVYSRLRPRMRAGIDVISSLMAVGVVAVFVWLATTRLLRAFAIGETLPMGEYMPLTPIRLGFAIGIYLLATICLIKSALTILKVWHRHEVLI